MGLNFQGSKGEKVFLSATNMTFFHFTCHLHYHNLFLKFIILFTVQVGWPQCYLPGQREYVLILQALRLTNLWFYFRVIQVYRDHLDLQDNQQSRRNQGILKSRKEKRYLILLT